MYVSRYSYVFFQDLLVKKFKKIIVLLLVIDFDFHKKQLYEIDISFVDEKQQLLPDCQKLILCYHLLYIFERSL